MISGILITHGPVAEALLLAAEKIIGKQQYLYAFSNDGLSTNEIYNKLKEILDQASGEEGSLIMVCFKGGSCWNAVARLIKERDNVRLLSGVNLPILLSFITKRMQYNLDELVKLLKKDGRRAIEVLRMNRG